MSPAAHAGPAVSLAAFAHFCAAENPRAVAGRAAVLAALLLRIQAAGSPLKTVPFAVHTVATETGRGVDAVNKALRDLINGVKWLEQTNMAGRYRLTNKGLNALFGYQRRVHGEQADLLGDAAPDSENPAPAGGDSPPKPGAPNRARDLWKHYEEQAMLREFPVGAAIVGRRNGWSVLNHFLTQLAGGKRTPGESDGAWAARVEPAFERMKMAITTFCANSNELDFEALRTAIGGLTKRRREQEKAAADEVEPLFDPDYPSA